MIPTYESAWTLHQFFTKRGIPYMFIGGMAVQFWGEPRVTRDVDVSVMAEPGSESDLVAELLAHFEGRIPDAAEFAKRNRVLLIRIPGLTEADISFTVPGYEAEALKHAVPSDLGGGREVSICSAEDLIIHKAVAGRSQDERDIEGIIQRQSVSLDADYIRYWLREFVAALEMPEIAERFERLWEA